MVGLALICVGGVVRVLLMLDWVWLLLVRMRIIGWEGLELLMPLWGYGRLRPLRRQRLCMEEVLLGRWGGVVAALMQERLVWRIVVVVLAPVAAPVEDSGAFGVR